MCVCRSKVIVNADLMISLVTHTHSCIHLHTQSPTLKHTLSSHTHSQEGAPPLSEVLSNIPQLLAANFKKFIDSGGYTVLDTRTVCLRTACV